MFVRALIAFLVLPGAFAFLLPPVIATFDSWRGEMWPEGYPFQVLGALIILLCVREFYVTGKGTLAPWCPPKHLVVIGPYRYVRNPVYIGVVLLVSGWALVTRSVAVGVYTALLGIVFHIRVVLSEEPRLSRQFPSQWPAYFASVPRWIPRTTPRKAE